MENKVLATVAGEEITEAEFNAFLQNVPREQQAYLSNPAMRSHYLDQLHGSGTRDRTGNPQCSAGDKSAGKAAG